MFPSRRHRCTSIFNRECTQQKVSLRRIRLTKVIAISPEHSKALLNRGRCRSAIGDLLGAVQDLTRAASYDPETPNIFRSREEAYRGLEQLKLAEADNLRAKELERIR